MDFILVDSGISTTSREMMTSTGAIPRIIHFVTAETELLVRKIFALNDTANEKKTNNISMSLLSVLGWGFFFALCCC